MTGEDHNTNSMIAALRSPALPAEQVGEAAAVSAMLEVLPTAVPARPSGLRSRRGVAIAAVTVASLGVGGLVAAGPGFFQAAANRPLVTPVPSVVTVPTVDDQGEDSLAAPPTDKRQPDAVTPAPADPVIVDDIDDDAIECVGDTHGETVSSVARATEPGPEHGAAVSAAAQADCGKADDDDGVTEDAVECVGDTHGETVSSIAKETEPGPDHGDVVSEAAQTKCGDDDGPEGDAPGQSGEAPGQSGEAPGQSGEAPGQSGEAPGTSGELTVHTLPPKAVGGPPSTLPGQTRTP